LEPWEGYAVRAFRDCELLIPPIPADGGALPDVPDVPTYDWLVELAASAGDFEDGENSMGVAADASDGYDPLDSEDVAMMMEIPEEMAVPDLERFEALVAPPVSLYFPHPDWEADSGPYLQDIRATGSGDKVWNVEVLCDVPDGTTVTLSWTAVVEVPEGIQLVLVDPDDSGEMRDMQTESSYSFASAGNGTVRHLQVILSGAAIGVQDDPASLPSVYKLYPSYPNPFSPSVTIRYDLPEASRVSLEVFDVSGRVVRVLETGTVTPAGQHHVIWDGRGATGRLVASGVYFYRLEAGAYTETQQMMLSR
jgi:hypothetical protein